MSRCSPPWTERCVPNRLKSSASSVPTWIVLNCANSILESLILSTAEKYLPQLNLVMTAPGIQSFAAIGIISEIGVDMSVFPTSKHLCSWAGLTPQNNESAGKKKTTRISRAGAYIKPLLVQCALCAIRAKQFPEVRNRYLALKKRRGHKKAIIAIARMLLTAIYNMLKIERSRTILNSTVKADRPPAHREVSVEEASLHPPAAGLSGNSSAVHLGFKHNFNLRPLLGGLVLCALFRNGT